MGGLEGDASLLTVERKWGTDGLAEVAPFEKSESEEAWACDSHSSYDAEAEADAGTFHLASLRSWLREDGSHTRTW
jgi:hypothetical protein